MQRLYNEPEPKLWLLQGDLLFSVSPLRLRLLRGAAEPGLISIPDPIHNPGLRERGPNEEMRHRGKVAEQSSKEGSGTAEEACFSVLVCFSLLPPPSRC